MYNKSEEDLFVKEETLNKVIPVTFSSSEEDKYMSIRDIRKSIFSSFNKSNNYQRKYTYNFVNCRIVFNNNTSQFIVYFDNIDIEKIAEEKEIYCHFNFFCQGGFDCGHPGCLDVSEYPMTVILNKYKDLHWSFKSAEFMKEQAERVINSL